MFVEFAAAERMALQRRMPCLVCGGPAYVLGTFIPAGPRGWEIAGKPREGKRRVCFYSLCQTCFSLPEGERTERVEKAMRENPLPSRMGPR